MEHVVLGTFDYEVMLLILQIEALKAHA